MKGPLEGVTVLDLSFYLAGPYCGHILSDLGARIIKVEPPGTGDPSRRGLGLKPGSVPNSQFIAIQRNKESLALDIRSAAGLETLYDLVRRADILIENYRPGVTKRLKIDYDTLRRVNAGLVYCTITGFGSDGPLSQKPAFDYIIQAMSGCMRLTGGPDGPPRLMGIFMGDLAASWVTATAAIAALYRRRVQGTGTRIDISMLESLLYLAPSQTQDALLNEDNYSQARGSITAAGRALKAKDGGYVTIHCPYPKFQESLRRLIGAVEGFEELLDDARFGPESRQDNVEAYWSLIEQAFLTKTRDEWVAALESVDIPCGPVNSISEALQIPQLAYRKMILEVEFAGAGPVRTFGSPFNFPDSTGCEVTRPPYLGEHTENILAEVAGYTSDRIAAIKAAGAFGPQPASGTASPDQ